MPTCEFCDRTGVMIYPVRYAVACPAGADGVPGLSGNFKIDAAPQEIGTAKYTLRAMRAGYLYAYDEKRKRLKAYLVLPMGHLWHFPVEMAPPEPARIQFRCIDPGDLVRSHCVDIDHSPSDPATKLWLGWSSVVWTPALLKQVHDAAWRRKHMQCIDVLAMLSGSAAHSAEFKQHYKQVSHFGADTKAMKKAYSYSNTPVKDETRQHNWGAKLAETMATQAPYHKGFIVAVNDPVGITNDLSELVLPTLDAGFNEDVYRGKMIADLIESTKHKVQEQARNNLVFDENIATLAKDDPKGDVYNGIKMGWGMITAGGLGNYERKMTEGRKKFGDDLAGRQEAAAANAWDELITDGGKLNIDKARLEAFPTRYELEIKQFEPLYIKLTHAHASWLKSEQLANWMNGVHDSKDIVSGYAYSESVAQCIGKAVTTKPCADLLKLWLSSDKLDDVRNLYSRALLFNQDLIIAGTISHLKGSDFQVEAILNIYKGALERVVPNVAGKLFDRLALATANILIGGLRAAASTMRSMAILHMSILTGNPIKASNVKAGELSKWIIEQARENGVQFNTSNMQTRVAIYKEAKRAVQSRVINPGIIAFELDIAQLERTGYIAPGTLKNIKIPGLATTKKWLGSTLPAEFHLGVATTIIQMIALGFASQDLINNDRFNERETRTKTIIAIISLNSTIVDVVASSIEKSYSHPFASFLRGQWAMSLDTAKVVAKGARYVGAAAGVFAGAYDIFFNMREAYGNGKYLLSTLYVVNGVLGISLAAVALYATGAVFWSCLVASFIIGILIAIVNPSALKQWISHCYFSIDASAKIKNRDINPYPYPELIEELKAYHSALGA
ncbi:MAG: T6SS effector BTH_I2691 family protein [Pseudomonadota bacterium]